MFSAIKDSLASSAVKSFLASRIERYGIITKLHINSGEKSIETELLLLGDESPVSIRIERYRTKEKAGKYSLVVENVTASRPWLHNLLEDKLVDKPISVPSAVLIALGKPE